MGTSAPIAITGMGCLSGAGMNLPESLQSMFRNQRYPHSPRRFSTDHPVSYPVLELRDEFKLPLDNQETVYARTSQLALAAALEALADAGWTAESLRGKRVGVCIGTTVGCSLNCDDFYRAFKANGAAGNPDMGIIQRFLRSNPSAVIARQLKLDGPKQTVVNACSSGTEAIGIGASWLKAGACDIVIAGGADELARVTYAGFSSLMISDTEPCKPFDLERKGLNLGEGAGILILESAAVRESKKARGYLLGYGSASDAHHLTAPHPDGTGLKRALTEAFTSAAVTPEMISFINAHGTGTPDNDRVECRVMNEILPGVPFVSTKGYTGHTLGAAGGIEAAFTVACLQRGELPASIGFATADPELAATPVTENTPVSGEIALSESLAFGGNNGVLIFSRGDA
ncbi:3-oxoacyl-[acyl-carrier-protein] synthase II [Desulfuromusa kysingii]|uniref:3-oxoacyl-[acyl-carrier-protein] synthase II n=1 Tax=Desulfuromusa kysingii TaxID=37625 RepID=A0A1H3VPK5_9BACT|nr:beta-ketoacyl-[acyl-carrier-protein] synthase family protein [Desulfuromusa kysingii]SDZ76743.1 3-oxoacyl-[acyl-carrier-protein] synthase II [Desulfuromusa kysingii]